jgi:hypothetical protein
VTYNGKTTTFTVTVTARPVLSSISAVYTQGGTVYTTDTLDSLKADLVVTAHYSDSSTAIVPAADYALSGALTEGTSTITVSYGGKTTTFNVTVTRYQLFDYIYNSATPASPSEDTQGQEWVATGLKHAPSWSTLNIEFEAMNSNDLSNADNLFAATQHNTTNTGNTQWMARVNKAGFSAYNLGVAKQLNMVPADTRAVIKYFFVDGGESYMEWDSNRVAVATVSKSSISNNNEALVLAGGRTTSATVSDFYFGLRKGAKTKLGYIKFTDPDSNTLLYHFIPAHDVAENRWGFYEAVNGIFYASNGTTDLRCANWEA